MMAWVCHVSAVFAMSALVAWSSSLAITLNGVGTFLEYTTGSAVVQNVSLHVRTRATEGILLLQVWSGGELLLFLDKSNIKMLVSRAGARKEASADGTTTIASGDWTSVAVWQEVSAAEETYVFTVGGTETLKLSLTVPAASPTTRPTSSVQLFVGGLSSTAVSSIAAGRHRLAACIDDMRVAGQLIAAASSSRQTAGGCDWCANDAICNNGGICYVNPAAGCDCSGARSATGNRKTGAKCEDDAKVGTFHGNAFLRHQLVNNCGRSANRISFDLETVDTNIVLMESIGSQNDDNRFKVSLVNGRVRAEIFGTDGSAPVIFAAESLNTINDEKWHSVRIVADMAMSITVDGTTANGSFVGPFPVCIPGELTLGAAADLATGTFYTGCMRALHINYEQPLESIYASRSQFQHSPFIYENVYIDVRCEPRIILCDERSEGVLLVDAVSSLSLKQVDTLNKLDIRFSFSSQMPDSLLASAAGESDYFYLTSRGGKLCLAARGSGATVSFCADSSTVADGKLHKVHIRNANGSLSLTVDSQRETKPFIGGLSVQNEIVFGNAKSPCAADASTVPDHGVQLPAGFRGCVRNVTVNGFCASWERDFSCTTGQKEIFTETEEDSQASSGTIFRGCRQNFCDYKGLCNEGTCLPLTTSFGCNCFGTMFTGRTCSRPAIAYTFYGNDNLLAEIPHQKINTELFFYYRTWKQTGRVALMMIVTNDSYPFAAFEQNDDSVVFWLNYNGTWVNSAIPYPGLASKFQHRKIGSTVVSEDTLEMYVQLPGEKATAESFILDQPGPFVAKIYYGSFPALQDLPPELKGVQPLRGHIRAAGLNSKHMFVQPEVAAKSPVKNTGNATFGEFPFDSYTTFFRTPEVYKEVSKSSFNLQLGISHLRMQFKTGEADDAVIFDAQKIFIVLHGRRLTVHLRPFQRSSDGEVIIRFPKFVKIYKRLWHEIEYELVDDTVTVTLDKNTPHALVRKVLLPPAMTSYMDFIRFGGTNDARMRELPLSRGFAGCIRGLFINKHYEDLHAMDTKGTTNSSADIWHWCPACSPNDPCLNDGLCTELGDDKYKCECNDTGHEGTHCSKESQTATFRGDEEGRFLHYVPRSVTFSSLSELSFIYRSWEQTGVVALVTLRDPAGNPVLLVEQVDDSVRVTSALLSSQPKSFPLAFSVSDFKYQQVKLKFPSNQVSGGANSIESVTVEVFIARKKLGTLTANIPNTETLVDFGTPKAGEMSAPITRGAYFKGHVRSLFVNGHSVLKKAKANETAVVTYNCTLREEPFSLYTVYFHKAEARKHFGFHNPITMVAFEMRPKPDNDGVFIDINAGLYGSVTLMKSGDTVILLVRHDASTTINETTAAAPLSPDPLNFQKVSLVIDEVNAEVRLSVGRSSVTARLPFQTDLVELLQMVVGGGSRHRLRQLNVKTGFRGCIQSLHVNDDYQDTVAAKAHGVESPDDIQTTCLHCQLLEPCKNNGTCLNSPQNFTCNCTKAFVGRSCEIDVDECGDGSHNCDRNAACANTYGSFVCTCLAGYTGGGISGDCQDVDECATGSHSCDGNATCANTEGSFNCSCNVGFTGNGTRRFCEDIDECSHGSHSCHGNATCSNTAGLFGCSCNFGFTGNGTERGCDDVDECVSGSHDCDQNAACLNAKGSFTCRCITGYTGNGTQGSCLDLNECSLGSHNCDNNADCKNDVGSFMCSCNVGFTGNGMQDGCHDVNECGVASDDCDSNAVCTNTKGSFHCSCNAGYTGNGSQGYCEDVNECALGSHECDMNAVCTNINGSHNCTCVVGFAGQGTEGHCKDVNECQRQSHNCDSNATCTNNRGSFSCACNVGFSGDGIEGSCTDLDECLTDERCDDNAHCKNIVGSFLCVCNAGFTGNGSTGFCQDVDECSVGSHNCDINGFCTDTRGSFNCSCNAGFSGNGTMGGCHDVDECIDNSQNCDERALCTNTKKGSFKCACTTGFEGTGQRGHCQDIDECTTGTHNCDASAFCKNNNGSFSCHCNTGYTGNGTQNSCQDIDECGLGSDNCDRKASCRNSNGSFACTCDSGFTGNGTSGNCHDADECSNGDHRCDDKANCTNTHGSFTCACKAGFSGNGSLLNCEDINECIIGDHDCDDTGAAVCVNAQGSFGCHCRVGYTGNGTRGACKDADECSAGSHSCDENAACLNTVASFVCNCSSGFSGNGSQGHCTDDDECDTGSHDCDNKAGCRNTKGSYACSCMAGYTGNATRDNCQDIDECRFKKHNCDANAECANTGGSFNCSCKPGFEGNGTQGSCQDIDECKVAGGHNCDDNAICLNTVSNYSCRCSDGYSGNGQRGNCKDIDECGGSSHDCDSNATCLNSAGSFSCICFPGLTGNGKRNNCSDIDECKVAGGHNCDDNAICINTVRNHSCRCLDGYAGNGQRDNCKDIDECGGSSHDCDSNATCLNSAGSFSCICFPGLTGNGKRNNCSAIRQPSTGGTSGQGGLDGGIIAAIILCLLLLLLLLIPLIAYLYAKYTNRHAGQYYMVEQFQSPAKGVVL